MTVLERTRQQLDPVGTLGSRALAVALAAGALLYGVIQTIRSIDQVVSLALAVIALLMLASATLTLVVATSPTRAPFGAPIHVLVHALVIGAAGLSAASQWGSNVMIQDDYAPVALGMLILAIGSYRPARELAAIGSVSGAFIGLLSLIQVPTFDSSLPPLAFVLIGMTPVLALSYAAAAFSSQMVGSIERWQRSAARVLASRTGPLRDGIARSVQRERVTILGRDVLPFFNSVLERGTVTASDRTRARELAESIRALMVAEADRTWLEVVATDDGVGSERLGRVVADPEGVASAMTPDQRVALRALIIAVLDDSAPPSPSLTIELDGRGEVNRGLLVTRFGGGDSFARSTLAPYVAVMRAVFDGVEAGVRNQTLTVEFSYEQQ